MALLNERIEDDIMSFDPDVTCLETQLYRRSLSVAKNDSAIHVDIQIIYSSATRITDLLPDFPIVLQVHSVQ